MSQRSMVEINHDFSNFKDPEWVRQFGIYIGSGSPKDLPRGVTYFYRRHHSDDCPMGDPPHGWDNSAPYKEPLWTPKRTRLAIARRLRKLLAEAADVLEGVQQTPGA